MRNLVVLQELRSRLPAHGGDASLEKLAVDPYLGIIYVITKDKHVIGLAPFSNEVTPHSLLAGGVNERRD
jgi:hypothetical protein